MFYQSKLRESSNNAARAWSLYCEHVCFILHALFHLIYRCLTLGLSRSCGAQWDVRERDGPGCRSSDSVALDHANTNLQV